MVVILLGVVELYETVVGWFDVSITAAVPVVIRVVADALAEVEAVREDSVMSDRVVDVFVVVVVVSIVDVAEFADFVDVDAIVVEFKFVVFVVS